MLPQHLTKVLDLDQLTALEAAATPGEWERELKDGRHLVRAVYSTSQGRVTAWPAACECEAQPNGANAAFIAAIRNSALALIATARYAVIVERIAENANRMLADEQYERENETNEFSRAITAANARIAELEAALRPFAKSGEFFLASPGDATVLFDGLNETTISQFRAAYAAMRPKVQWRII